MNEEPKFTVEEVGSVAPPPRASVEESASDKLERKRDYLEGFLKDQPQGVAAGEPGGDLYEAVIAALRDIFDPEIPVNIVDLGLVYRCELEPMEGGDVRALIDLTLAAPGCGMGEAIADEVCDKVLAIPRVGEITVNMVFDPPWDRSRMSEAAMLSMGM